MKRVILLIAVIAIVAIGLLVFTSRNSHIAVVTGDGQYMEKMSRSFIEDLQFKDFQKAASYHSHENRKKVDIPVLIERLFAIKPEFLNIMRYEVVKVQFDSSGKRCRVLVKTVVKILNTKEIKEPEIMLYWFKDPSEGWVMELESSLH